ncbi:MAG: YcxB family protein [Streptococcaceae bacterium]|nr:YcxB family protein [Streptococcaceae bacterium]
MTNLRLKYEQTKKMNEKAVHIFTIRISNIHKSEAEKKRYKLRWILFLGILSAALIVTGLSTTHRAFSLYIAFLILFIIIPRFFPGKIWNFFILFNKKARRTTSGIQYVEINNQGLSVFGYITSNKEDVSLEMKWSEFDNIYLTKDFIFFMNSPKSCALWIPKNGLLEGNIEEAIEKIRLFYPIGLIELD